MIELSRFARKQKIRSLLRRGLGGVSHSDGHSVVKGKKEVSHIHNRTTRMALTPLVFVLVCVCNWPLLFNQHSLFSWRSLVGIWDYHGIPHRERFVNC